MQLVILQSHKKNTVGCPVSDLPRCEDLVVVWQEVLLLTTCSGIPHVHYNECSNNKIGMSGPKNESRFMSVASRVHNSGNLSQSNDFYLFLLWICVMAVLSGCPLFSQVNARQQLAVLKRNETQNVVCRQSFFACNCQFQETAMLTKPWRSPA